jgi:hypothetical protein
MVPRPAVQELPDGRWPAMTAFSRGSVGLIVASLVSVVGVTAWYGQRAWEDSGAFAFLLFGVPLVCAALALAAERVPGSTIAPLIVTVLGLVSVGWSVVTGLGIGLAFLLPSLLLLVAAMVSWVDRRGSAAALRT